LIRGGTVVDGTGAPAFEASVAVADGRIAGLFGAHETPRARRSIDASGLVVAPGFIDIHSHSDAALLVNPRAESKVRQGVTTEVIGQCGYSIAPLVGGVVEDIRADLQVRYGLVPDWSTFGDYLDVLESGPPCVNVVPVLGHGTVRKAVVGFDERPPTRAEMLEMERMVAEALQEGAGGLSTGLVYPPGSFAEAEELIGLARVVARFGGIYFTHVRGEDDRLVTAIEEAVQIGREAGVAVQVAHHKNTNPSEPGLVRSTLDMMRRARARGIHITADQYPYTASSTGLGSLLPGWAHAGGTAALLERLRDEPARAKIRAELERAIVRSRGWSSIRLSLVGRPEYKRFEGMDLESIAAHLGVDPCSAVFQLLLDTELDAWMISFSMEEDDVRTILRDTSVMVSTDGSALAPYGPLGEGKPHPRNYGAFPRVLGRYVREERVLPLEAAVHKMTAAPAAKLGRWDRGLLRPGLAADVVVFDPERVRDTATYESPHSYPEGIHYVIVNGAVVVDGGDHTGVRSGRVLRRASRGR